MRLDRCGSMNEIVVRITCVTYVCVCVRIRHVASTDDQDDDDDDVLKSHARACDDVVDGSGGIKEKLIIIIG